jgi:hypothetical protein
MTIRVRPERAFFFGTAIFLSVSVMWQTIWPLACWFWFCIMLTAVCVVLERRDRASS